jgi:hypothetical protein
MRRRGYCEVGLVHRGPAVSAREMCELSLYMVRPSQKPAALIIEFENKGARVEVLVRLYSFSSSFSLRRVNCSTWQ